MLLQGNDGTSYVLKVSFEMKLTQLILCWDFTIFIFWHLISILLKRSGVADSIQLTIQFPFSFPEQFCSEHRKAQHRGPHWSWCICPFVRLSDRSCTYHINLMGFKFWYVTHYLPNFLERKYLQMYSKIDIYDIWSLDAFPLATIIDYTWYFLSGCTQRISD